MYIYNRYTFLFLNLILIALFFPPFIEACQKMIANSCKITNTDKVKDLSMYMYMCYRF